MGILTNNKQSTEIKEEEKEMVVLCDCGCGEGISLRMTKYHLEPEPEYFLDLFSSDFYSEQHSKLKTRLKRGWNGFTGKDKHLKDVVLTREDFLKLVNELTKWKEEYEEEENIEE